MTSFFIGAAASLIAKATVLLVLGFLATWLTRRSRAAVRHALLAAVFGALLVLPIASFVSTPVRIAVLPAARPSTPSGPLVIDGGSPAISSVAPVHASVEIPAPISRPPSFPLSAGLLAVWLGGTLLFLLPVAAGLWQVRALRESARPWLEGQLVAGRLALDAGIYRLVEVGVHGALAGPMTCGVFRPVIVLSEDATVWEREDLDRAMLHELEHVRRLDWMIHCLARVACAVYWFHPLVWIAWRRLALESERSCDDAVLAGSEATAYADQLVGLAQRFSAAAKTPFLAMANRADLGSRIGAVLDSGQRRGRAGKSSLALVCAVASALVVTISPLRMTLAAQTLDEWEVVAGGSIAFQTASVELAKSFFRLPTFPLHWGDAKPPGGEFKNTSNLVDYISFAYKLSFVEAQNLRVAAPEWGRREAIAIDAHAEGNPTKDQMRLIMRSLLADRFKLAVHFETSQAPVFAMRLVEPGRTGPRLLPHSEDPPCPVYLNSLGRGALLNCGDIHMSWGKGVRSLSGRDIPVGYMLDMIAMIGKVDSEIEKPVVDETGLQGRFDFTVQEDPPPPVSEGIPFLTAVREQLGLKLVSITGPVRTLVIDHVERPFGR